MNCILCESARVIAQDEVRAADLIALYKRAFNVDVSAILRQDLVYFRCESCDLRFFALKSGEIPTGSDDFYNTLNQLDWYYLSEKDEYNYARKFILRGDKVLETGCGAGKFALLLGNSCKYQGLEFSTRAKDLAAQNGVSVENLSIEDFAESHAAQFDVACSFQVLEHVANPRNFIRAQLKMLARGGSSLVA